MDASALSDEKFVLLSGAAGGIGRATVRVLVGAGYTVFAGVLNDAEATLIARSHHAGVIPLQIDVRSPESIEAVINAIRDRLAPNQHLVGLINNAGVDYNAPLQYLVTDEIGMMVGVNFLGPVLLTRAAIPLLRERPSRVVFTSSATALVAPPIAAVYAATKIGLEGFVDGMRVELAPLGIRVSAIEPGVVQTPMSASAPQMFETMLNRMSAIDRGIYEAAMRKIVHMSAGPGAGISADKVAQAILHALTSEHPESRYPVGSDAKAVSLLRHFPESWKDFFQRTTFRL